MSGRDTSARERVRMWHGGPLFRGGLLLPPTATGVCRSDPNDPDEWVYVTPRRALAETYAATCRGWVYEVEPIGPVEQDPGSLLEPGVSLRCLAARVVRRFKLSNADADRITSVVERLRL